MLIGSLSLGGFPFLTGFYSKDLILEVSAGSTDSYAPFIYSLGVVSAFFTVFYSFRLLYLTFASTPRGYREVYTSVGGHESPPIMVAVLTPLAFLSIFVGYFSRELFVGSGTDFFGSSLFQSPANLVQDWVEFLPLSLKLLPLFFAFSGGLLSFLFHFFFFHLFLSFQLGSFGLPLYKLLNGRWFFDSLQNQFIAYPSTRFGYVVAFKSLDRGAIEQLGPTGLFRFLDYLTGVYTKLHSGYIYHYVFFTLFSSAVLLLPLFGLGFRFPLLLLLISLLSIFNF
jgi:NADH-ubiquinone oxidoreductase chain 5